jgi:2-amino-4-hydroxy-6-hydroxymethyldihydropteridine diphosphokinase
VSRPPELDPERFARHRASPRGFPLAYTREGEPGAEALLLLHGWPETRRIWWRNLEPLARAGFDVVAPDLRGFGDSASAPDGAGDVVSHSRDLYALVRGTLGLERIHVVAGDLGGAVAQDLSLRFPGFVDRMLLFNCPLPYLEGEMATLRTRPPSAVLDYYLRQGKDADALAAELDTEAKRRDYVQAFYTTRGWAHPGSFSPEAVDFHVAPFLAADELRASFRAYESVFDPKQRVAPALWERNPTPTAVLFGISDAVMPPDFDAMAAAVFPNALEIARLEGAGHFLQWEAPDALHATLARHCRAPSAPVAPETRALVSLGSNLGAREFELGGAVAALRATPGVRELVVSRTYETDPVGPGEQGAYLNAAARFETTLAPRALLERLQEIERKFGRERGAERDAARTLDLDLLYFGVVVLDEPGLTLPHPRILERPFVLEPLCDLAPELVPPRESRSIRELASRVRDPAAVRPRS